MPFPYAADFPNLRHCAGEKLPDASAWGAGVGVSKTTAYRWVSHIINRDKDERKAVVWLCNSRPRPLDVAP